MVRDTGILGIRWLKKIHVASIALSAADKPRTKYMKACALNYGKVYDYTIPSFSLIKVTLHHTVIQISDNDGVLVVLDAFF